MPEFILDRGDTESAERFADLDSFTQGYIEAMFWLANDESDQDEYGNPNEHPEWSFDMLAAEALATVAADCADFQSSFAAQLDEAYDNESVGYSEARAGHDFWLTRNHHGAGFWDRGLGKVGDDLTEMTHPYGETDLYRGDDTRLYLG